MDSDKAFEVWWAELNHWEDSAKPIAKKSWKAAWDASRTQALFEANNRAGDAANEGMKKQRLTDASKAVEELLKENCLGQDDHDSPVCHKCVAMQIALDAIIAKAQG